MAAAQLFSRLTAAALILVLALGATWRVLAVAEDRKHPDEIIAVQVGHHLSVSLDTNWGRVQSLPRHFHHTPQYNFSAYILAANGALTLAGAASDVALSDEQRLAGLRVISFLLGLATIALTFLVARRVGCDRLSSLFAATLAAIAPSLFMDSLYARPETFVVTLCLGFVLALLSPDWRVRELVAGFVVGVLIATKIYFVVLIPPLLLSGGGVISRRKAAALAAVLAGTFLGMPAAFLHPLEYIEGVVNLGGAYGDVIWPHGLGASSGILARLGEGLLWTIQTGGAVPLVLASVALAVLAARRQRPLLVAFAPFLVLLIYFCTTAVFFERNLSQSLALVAILAGLGLALLRREVARRGGSAIAAMAVAAIVALSVWPPLTTSRDVAHAVQSLARHDADVAGRRAMLAAIHRTSITPGVWLKPKLPSCVPGQVVELLIPGEGRGKPWRAAAPSRWVEIERVESLFPRLVPSTLHTYLSPTVVWLRCDALQEASAASPVETTTR